jgi:hypothetical protein
MEQNRAQFITSKSYHRANMLHAAHNHHFVTLRVYRTMLTRGCFACNAWVYSQCPAVLGRVHIFNICRQNGATTGGLFADGFVRQAIAVLTLPRSAHYCEQ